MPNGQSHTRCSCSRKIQFNFKFLGTNPTVNFKQVQDRSRRQAQGSLPFQSIFGPLDETVIDKV